MGGVGDVYYCEMTVFGHIENHEFKRYAPEKFKFIWGDTQMKVVGDGYMSAMIYNLDFFSAKKEWFTANDISKTMRVYFRDGNFIYSQTLNNEVFSTSAKCDKF